MVDARAGLRQGDAEVAQILRRGRLPGDRDRQQGRLRRATRRWPPSSIALGLGEPVAVSAGHGRGTGDLLDRMVATLLDARPDADPAAGRAPEAPDEVRLAVIGRPNVGKSSLVNAISGRRG